MNKPQTWYGNGDKHIYEFWLVIAENPPLWESKINSKSMEIRFWAQCDVLGAPMAPQDPVSVPKMSKMLKMFLTNSKTSTNSMII